MEKDYTEMVHSVLWYIVYPAEFRFLSKCLFGYEKLDVIFYHEHEDHVHLVLGFSVPVCLDEFLYFNFHIEDERIYRFNFCDFSNLCELSRYLSGHVGFSAFDSVCAFDRVISDPNANTSEILLK